MTHRLTPAANGKIINPTSVQWVTRSVSIYSSGSMYRIQINQQNWSSKSEGVQHNNLQAFITRSRIKDLEKISAAYVEWNS